MNKVISLIALLIIVLWGCSSPNTNVQEYASFEQSKFKEPDNTFRSVPFYSLNDSLSAEELARQLKLMKEGGFGGAFLHSRIGLLTPYLSEEWFQIMEAGVKACQELDMDAWFYDEDGYPSGYAGGIVPLMSRDYCVRTLGRVPKDWDLMTEDDELLWEDEEYKYVSYAERTGQSRYNGGAWVDLMNPEMVKAFIDCTYRPYVERFAGQPNVKGIFMDEAQVCPRRVPGATAAVSYSPYVDATFKKLWGYDLRPVIPSLFGEVGDWRTVRLHYYRTIAHCFENSFTRQIAEYCAEHGLIWTGHYNYEEFPAKNMQNEGNLSQQFRTMQMPGIDALGLRYNPTHNGKVLTSTANQYGISRRLSELFGIGGQNMSFEDRMWITSWHTIMGVNFMCPHLYLYSMKGERKRDYPPTISHQQPYWSQNKLFEDYSARLCYFATVGKTKAEVCIISPIESDYIDEVPKGSIYTEKIDWDTPFEDLMNQLMAMQVNSDIGDEGIIAEIGSVDDGCFKIGQMNYQVVILPPMRTIRPSTLELLEAFAKEGGDVLVVDRYPDFVEGKENKEAIEQLKSYSTLVSKSTLQSEIDNVYTPVFTLEGEHKQFIWSHLREVKDGYVMQLSNTSRLQTVVVDVKLSEPDQKVMLWDPISGDCLHLSKNEKGLYTLEFSPARTWLLTIGKPSEKVIANQVYQISSVREPLFTLDNIWKQKRQNVNVLPLDFAAWSIDGGKTMKVPEPVLAIHTRFMEEKPYNGALDLCYSFDVDCLPKFCAVAIEQPWIYKNIKVNGNEVFFDKSKTYVDHSIYQTEITSLLKKGHNKITVSLDYKSAVKGDINAVKRYGSEIEAIYLVGDFAIKGRLAKEQPTDTWRNQEKTLAPKLMPTRFQYSSFTLSDENKEVKGDLIRQGYPFYAGSMDLSQVFHLERVDKQAWKYILSFKDLETILVGVTLNGKKLPTLFSAPWECDITEALVVGENKLTVTLTNSLRNLMGPHHHVGGEFTQVGSSVFKGNQGWPNLIPGDKDWYDARIRGNAKLWRDDYYCIPFGLLKAPMIEVEKRNK
ncbi:MAG: hypothetical protein E7085_05710 [Parabacteroides distasonis]|nr:hypothetical protein [Parabacteroides distasonis]